MQSLRLKPNECVCEYGVLGDGRELGFVRYMCQLVAKGDRLGHVRQTSTRGILYNKSRAVKTGRRAMARDGEIRRR